MGYIDSAKADGATIYTGGERVGTSGYFLQPTVITNATPDMKIVKEEVRFLGDLQRCSLTGPSQIFGPVLAVGKFDTEEEAIRLANDTSYGLGAGIQSSALVEADDCPKR